MNSRKIYSLAQMFVLLIGCTLGLFTALGVGSMIQIHLSVSPVSSMNGLASTLSDDVFKGMFAMEVPHIQSDSDSAEWFGEPFWHFLFQFVTGVHPQDPKTMMAMEVPGLARDRAVLFRSGQAGGDLVRPMDMTPPTKMLEPNEVQDIPDGNNYEEVNEPAEPSESTDLDESSPASPDNPDAAERSGSKPVKKSVFIYHSHNRESWLPELEGKTSFSEAFDPEINITLLGARLAEKLEQAGIGAVSSNTDYPTSIPDYNWNYSYKYSLETVREATAIHPGLEYYFDLHRDAQARDLTTVTIDGVDYAQLYFIIGHRNPNWEKNEAFASAIHERLEQKYPGISRGVWGKTASTGHAEYNQSVSPNSFLIEIGGPENTLEESYRTIELFAEVFIEYYREEQGAEAL